MVFLLVARKYPTGLYGELITIFSIANIFMILFDLGLPVLLQKEISAAKQNSAELFSNIFAINLFIFPVYFILSFTYCKYFLDGFSFGLFFPVIISIYVFSVSGLLNKALSGLNAFKSQFISLLLSRIITLIFFFPAIYFFEMNLDYVLWILFIGAFIQFIILSVYIKRNKLKLSVGKINPVKIKSVISISAPLGFAVIFNFLYDKIDIVIISKLTNFDEVAFYSVAYGIFKTTVIAYSFLFASGLTRISFIGKNKRAVMLFLKKYSTSLFYICSVITIVLFFGAEIIVKLIYTDSFDNSVPVLKILSFAAIGLGLNSLTGVILNGLGLFKMNMIITLIGLIINVILNLYFIPVYGIAAAAIVTVLTEYFILSGDYYCIRKFLNE